MRSTALAGPAPKITSGASRRPARRPLRIVPLALLLAGVAGCSDGLNDPEPVGQSRVSLQYQGPLSGTFTAEGEPQLDKGMLDQTYAHGLRYQNPGELEISGTRYHAESGLVDWIDLQIPATQVGVVAIDQTQCPWWEEGCAGISFFLRLLSENGQQAKYSCMLLSGTIRVSSVSTTRAQGTFSGSGECVDRDDPEGAYPSITITGGEFDVKLRNGTRG